MYYIFTCFNVFACFIISIGFIVFLIAILYYKNRTYKNVIKQKGDSAKALFSKIEEISKERSILKERIIELEDGVKDKFGISVRQEITKVETNFSKAEMVFMMAGVYSLIKKSNNKIDIKYYLNLSDKLQSLIDKMDEKEEDVFKEDKGKV
jgi:uncharacterized protein YoxC